MKAKAPPVAVAGGSIAILPGIDAIDRGAWDAVANPGWPCERPLAAPMGSGRSAYNPFVSHDFLWCLEASGSASAKAGWLPQHLVLTDAQGTLVAAMPAYRKAHSMGEYVFDHGWADAYGRAGGRYYPKLQASVPFTPVTGPRLLTAPGPDADANRLALARAASALAARDGLSSVHITFMPQAEWRLAAGAGYLQRTDQQFQFTNPGYRDFDDFLGALASRKRKVLKRERREAVEGLAIQHLTGADLTEAAWDAFFAFYMDTGGRKWGRPYLNRRFFSLVGERMADRILMVLALKDGRPIAGALNFIGSEALYGRYWGAVENVPFLHFELCYYQAIDWAIAHQLPRVEAGAQGEHKLARGYLPTTTYSAHWFADPRLSAAVADYLAEERKEVAAMAEVLAADAPFRHEPE